MSKFAPVLLSPERALNGRVSQTMLRHYARCPRSGWLYQETKGGTQTAPMIRGSAFHTIAERLVNLAVELGEPMVPPELAKVIVDEVLAEQPVVFEEQDELREMSWRFAEQWTVDPSAVAASETLFVLDVDGWQVRCKVDFAELRSEGLSLYVADHKTGKGMPVYGDIARTRSDGTLSAKTLQLVLYALALVFGRPVLVEPCSACPLSSGVVISDCEVCHGRGRVETIEPFPVAPRAQEVIAEFIYPAIEDGEGRMARRTMGLTRIELESYRESLRALVARLADSERTGDWPAVVSDAACNECPAAAKCPIPSELRDHRGEINTMEQLVEACERYFVEGMQREAMRKEIKATAKALGGPRARVRFGKDRVWEIGDLRESLTIADKDGMWAAVERAVNEGVPFERSDFEKIGKTTPFAERTLSEDELAEESDHNQEVSDGGQ